MKLRSLRIALASLTIAACGIGPAAFAQEEGTSHVDASLHKLGRGIANIATCPAELIRTPELVGRREGYVSAVSIGLVQGAWRTLVRGLTGAFEVATFFVEIPKGYGPLMKPEFVWEHGNWME